MLNDRIEVRNRPTESQAENPLPAVSFNVSSEMSCESDIYILYMTMVT